MEEIGLRARWSKIYENKIDYYMVDDRVKVQRDICKPYSSLACQTYPTIGQACPPSTMMCSCMYYGPMLCGRVQSEAHDD